MYLGRRPLGVEVAFTLMSVDDDGIPLWPTLPPILEVWRGSTLLMAGLKLHKVDNASTGLFRRSLFLDERFAAGQYRTILRWTAGSYLGVRIDHWRITPGGDPVGSIIAMSYQEMPNATFLVEQVDSGILKRQRNPRVS